MTPLPDQPSVLHAPPRRTSHRLVYRGTVAYTSVAPVCQYLKQKKTVTLTGTQHRPGGSVTETVQVAPEAAGRGAWHAASQATLPTAASAAAAAAACYSLRRAAAAALQVLGGTAACLSMLSAGTSAPAALSILLKKSGVPLQNSFTVVRGRGVRHWAAFHRDVACCDGTSPARIGLKPLWQQEDEGELSRAAAEPPALRPTSLQIAVEVRQGRNILLHLPPLLALPQRFSGPLHHHSRPHPQPGPLLCIATAGPDVSRRSALVALLAAAVFHRLLTSI